MALKFNSKPLKLIGGGGSGPSGPTLPTPGKELGRISGPLLADNLLRSGQNLAVDTSVMYLDVNNRYVGFNTNTPVRTLNISGLTYTPDIIVDTQGDLAHLSITTNQIADSFNENIILRPDQSTDPVFNMTGIGSTGKWGFVGASLTGFADQDFTLDPSGSGKLIIGDIASQTDVEITGGLHATGPITFDGDITLGNDNTDNITFVSDVASDIIPDDDNFWELGKGDPVNKSWLSVYSNTLSISDTLTNTDTLAGTLTAGNVRFTGNTISNIVTGNNLNFVTQDAGTFNFGSFLSVSPTSYITHNNNNILYFTHGQNGHFRFGGSNGLVISAGTTSERPPSPEIGTIRYNSTLNYVEVYANVSNTGTTTLVNINADAFTGDTTVYTNNTTGFVVGDFITSSTVPSAFPAMTKIVSFVGNTSVTFSNPLAADLLSGSNITVQRKWIPIIGTSPVLSQTDVENTMDVWTLILG